MRSRSKTLKRLIKPGVVLAGYFAAFLVADAALYLRELRMPAEAKTSVGMYAFGDLILFVEVFGVSATVPTALALYFLRPFRKLWLVFSIGCLTLAGTGLVAAAVVIWTHSLHTDVGVWQVFAGVGIIRTLLSPILASSFLVSLLVAPTWRCRWILLAATAMEGGAFASWFAWML
jgi:hypothetical protein